MPDQLQPTAADAQRQVTREWIASKLAGEPRLFASNIIVNELLRDIRSWLDDELANLLENYSEPDARPDRVRMRATIDLDDLEYIKPIELLITRIDEALADNRGVGI